MAAKLNRKDERQVREFTHTAIKSALHDALFCPLTLGEKHDIRVKPKFETACWSFLPPHRIYVGTGIVDRAKETLSAPQISSYIKSFVRHELAHAHYTERNMRKVVQALKEIDAPFQLFNLFEDGRIEDRYRREADFQFDWLDYEDLTFTERAEGMLFALIQAESSVPRVQKFIETVDIAAANLKQRQELDKQIAESKNPMQTFAMVAAAAQMDMGPPVPVELERARALSMLDRVVPYYRKIIAAENTAATYPILKEWMEEFGKANSAPSMGCSGGEGEKSDLQLGGELANDAEAREKFEADTETVESGKDGKCNGTGKAEELKDDGSIACKGKVLQDHGVMPDLDRADRLCTRFKKFFESEARTVATSTPQRKVSARHFAVNRPYFRVKQVQGKAKKKIVIEVDCSGSMGGFHMEEGKVLLAALSRLARQGYVEGHVLLSAGSPSRWELYALPVADAVIAKISAFAGAEGLEPTLKAHMPLLQAADYVFVYTDAQITDRPINKPDFHRYGVYTWGLYAGEQGDYLEEKTDRKSVV